MPTDEQLRERFEEVRGKGYPDHANEYLFQRDEFDNYMLSGMNSQWHGWRMAYRSRDAEVQRLKSTLETMVAVFRPRSAPGPDAHAEAAAHHNAVLLLAEYLPEKEAVDAY